MIKNTAIITLLFTLLCSAQSLSDLQDLQTIKKELDKISKTTDSQQPEDILIPSLETFQDSLSRIPAPAADADLMEQLKGGENELPLPTEPFTDLANFGHDIFLKVKPDYTPEVYGPVDEDYPLGPGDEIIITIWGEVELRHSLFVNRQGQIYIKDVGLINLMGLTITQARQKLKKVMGRSYSSITKGKAYLDVSLGKLRILRVYTIGNVNQPGTFNVPALSSAFHLLFYAGGITPNASLRHVLVVRDDKKVAELDFYKFLTEGKKFSNVRLQNYDVVVVPAAELRIQLDGAVNIRGVFELKKEEGLKELFKFCGGLQDDAYLKSIQIERIIEHEDRRIINVDYKELIAANGSFVLKNGDHIFVSEIDREIKNYVDVDGPIFGPTRFEYYNGLTIKSLLSRVDSIRGDAYLERVQIVRTLPNQKTQIFSVNLKDIIGNSGADFTLAPQDRISIRSINELFPADSVMIYGAVNTPGTYLLKKDMNLNDLVFEAGGFTPNALLTEAEVSRIYPIGSILQNNLAEVYYVPLDSCYVKTERKNDGDDFLLLPYDNVFIRSNSEWELQRNVYISGEINKPGLYSLETKTTRITDMIKRAGGLKATAYLAGGQLYRSGPGGGQIGIDFEKIFHSPDVEDNIYLKNGDRINIPERLVTVQVGGGVNFPSSVLFEPGQGLDYYIQAAGGYKELADEKNVTIRLANGRPVQRKQFIFWKYLSDDITAGSNIYVPVLTERHETDWSGAIRDAAAILASVATVLLIYDSVNK